MNWKTRRSWSWSWKKMRKRMSWRMKKN